MMDEREPLNLPRVRARRLRLVHVALPICLGVLLVARLAAVAPRPVQGSPATLLELVAAYVSDYEGQLGTVIAEERYVQTVTVTSAGEKERSGQLHNRYERHLVSDFLMLKIAGRAESWIGFRNVLKVDGVTVPDRDRRLEDIFGMPAHQVAEQARRFADEGARFNLGSVQRNINLPTWALQVLRGQNQHRFEFSAGPETSIERVPTHSISFREEMRPTLICNEHGQDVPIRGTVWVEPSSGRVIRTRVLTGEGAGEAVLSITVTYRKDERLGMWVPYEMREEHRVPSGERMEGRALYSGFRRFDVEVEMDVQVPGKKEPHQPPAR
jgi:hypothetical protein